MAYKKNKLKRVKDSLYKMKDKKGLLYGIGAVILLLVLWLFTKSKNKTAEGKADKITANNDMRNVALGIAHNLRTSSDYKWWHPRTWVENDRAVFDLLHPLTLAEFKTVETLYNQAYTNGRELRSDLYKHLNDAYLKKITYLSPVAGVTKARNSISFMSQAKKESYAQSVVTAKQNVHAVGPLKQKDVKGSEPVYTTVRPSNFVGVAPKLKDVPAMKV